MSKPRFRWTSEMTDYLVKNREKISPMPWEKIANRLSQLGVTMSILQCQDKMNRLREARSDNVRSEEVLRKCLNCQQKFHAPTRFIRVCPRCKHIKSWG